jgi:HAD superfamily hydrolase (TIGR01509 family)
MALTMNPELIIFDCDGVLIDSEGVASSVIAEELTALGWAMDAEDSMRLFMGMSITDMEPIIEARLGHELPPRWRPALAQKLVVALGTQSKLIPGAAEILRTVTARGINWRIASNSSDEEMAVKFARTGLTGLTQGRAHSAASVIAQGGRAKPAPDVFLAAARSAGVAPQRCIVLEDSALGVTGAVAAGMTCYGFAPHGGGEALRAAGAYGIFTRLDEILGVFSW